MNRFTATATLIAGAALVLTALWPRVRERLASGSGSGRVVSPLRVRRTARGPMRESAATARVSAGDTVRIHYTGWLSNNLMFDSSRGEEPLEFTLGAGHVIRGLEQVVLGMAVGETKLAVVRANDAYGPKVAEYLAEVPRTRLPPGEVRVGDLMEIPGSPIPARVAEFRGDKVLMDVNHPLAGEDLTFEVTLLDIIRSGGTQTEE